MYHSANVRQGPGSIRTAAQPRAGGQGERAAHAHFERPDLEPRADYLVDFGSTVATQSEDELFLRGAGSAPYIYRVSRGPAARFIGFGLSVPRPRTSRRWRRRRAVPSKPPTARRRRRRPPGRPGGVAVSIHHGFAAVAPQPVRAPIPHNAPNETVRVNDTQRPALEPPQVTKLGHLVLETPDFDRSARWYMDMLGFIHRTCCALRTVPRSGSFMRLDRGDEPSDHHTLFVATGLESKVDHVAFEVVDLDAVEMGQQILMAKRYRHAWGVGRHLLGSQIFDYWRDPWGQKHEHYADGDLFDAAQPAGYHVLDRQALSVGPRSARRLHRRQAHAAPAPQRAQAGGHRQAAAQEDACAEEQRREACPPMAVIPVGGRRRCGRLFQKEPHLPIRNQSDIAAIEAIPLSERALPESSYAALVEASKRSPYGQALSFFLSADRLDEAHVWTYAELVADVTRAANLFAALGVAADRPVAFVLPNLPDTHFADLGWRSRRRSARGQPDARTETDRGHPALRPRFDARHACSGHEPERVVRSGRAAGHASGRDGDRVRRHG